MGNNFQVFVIGAPHLRTSNVTPVLEAAKIPYEIIPATFLEIFPMEFNPARSLLLSKRRLGLGEIGCAQSHLNCYRKFLDSESYFALIFEDDAIIEFDNLPKIFLELSEFNELLRKKGMGNSILSFYTENAVGIRGILERSPFLKLKGFPSGAVAYAIGRNASLRLLETNANLDFVADWPRAKDLKFFLTKQKLVRHPETRSESLMHDRIIWRDPRQKFLVDTFKIFSLYAYFNNRNFFNNFAEYLRIMVFPMLQWQLGRIFGKQSPVWGKEVKLRFGFFH